MNDAALLYARKKVINEPGEWPERPPNVVLEYTELTAELLSD